MDPAIINYNSKESHLQSIRMKIMKVSERGSDTEEVDSIEIAQIWREMAKLKRDEATLYDQTSEQLHHI